MYLFKYDKKFLRSMYETFKINRRQLDRSIDRASLCIAVHGVFRCPCMEWKLFMVEFNCLIGHRHYFLYDKRLEQLK